MNDIVKSKWYEDLVEILKTKSFPSNYLDIKQKLLNGLREEVNKRISNILDTSHFTRRQYGTQNYRFREGIIRRDGRKCTSCGKIITDDLQVAHILPVELFPEYAFEIWNGQVKCKECHKKEGNYQFRRGAKNARKIVGIIERTRNYFQS